MDLPNQKLVLDECIKIIVFLDFNIFQKIMMT